MEWSDKVRSLEPSVLRITCSAGIYDPTRPYRSPKDRVRVGTGVVVDLDRGFVLTNSHVVENSIEMVASGGLARTNALDLSLWSYCPSKDLAICKLSPRSIIRLKEQGATPISMGDSLKCSKGEDVLAMGFPAGETSAKATSGVVSGFTSPPEGGGDVEDRNERPPAFIEVTAPLNPGCSGGPLINQFGEIVGIVSGGQENLNSVGYAIPSRSFLSIREALLSREGKVELPNLGLSLDPAPGGLRVKMIAIDSFLRDIIHEGDVIKKMGIGGDIEADISCDGTAKLCSGRCPLRKISIAEMMDLVPLESPIDITLSRGEIQYVRRASYVPRADSDRVTYRFLSLDPPDYIVISGVVIVDHTRNLQEALPSVRNIHDKCPIIVQVSLNSEIGKLDLFRPGDIVASVNGIEVSSVRDIDQTIDDGEIVIATRDGSIYTGTSRCPQSMRGYGIH